LLIGFAVVMSMVAIVLGLGQGTAGSDPAPVSRFSWPLPPPHQVLRPFQPPATRYGPGHRGVDLVGSVGEPVLVAGDGLVLFAGPIGGCDLISVEHPGGLRTTYEPVDPVVHVGQEVTRQQVIGHLLAARPNCPQEITAGSQLPSVFLYWGVHRDQVYLDPMRLVEFGQIRLLTWDGGR
jgi:murein DD-endopeptidase MepM/ murein hydrolase activator NlpD